MADTLLANSEVFFVLSQKNRTDLRRMFSFLLGESLQELYLYDTVFDASICSIELKFKGFSDNTPIEKTVTSLLNSYFEVLFVKTVMTYNIPYGYSNMNVYLDMKPEFLEPPLMNKDLQIFLNDGSGSWHKIAYEGYVRKSK